MFALDKLSTPDLLELHAILRKYSPDQPRDERGRFGEGGGDYGSDPAGSRNEAAVGRTEHFRSLPIASASHDWATTKPWAASVDDIRAGKVPGLELRNLGAGTIAMAHGPSGNIWINATQWENRTPSDRAGVLYHELGHFATASAEADPKIRETMLAQGPAPMDASTWGGLSSSVDPGGEQLANNYAEMATMDPPKSQDGGVWVVEPRDQQRWDTMTAEAAFNGYPSGTQIRIYGSNKDTEFKGKGGGNPYHEPAGSPEGGQFASAGGGYGAKTALMTDPKEMGKVMAARRSSERRAQYERLKGLSSSELSAVRGPDEFAAQSLNREKWGGKLSKDDQITLGLMHGDPKAEAQIARNFTKVYAASEPGLVSPEVRQAVSDAAMRVYSDPAVRDAMARVGMDPPPVFVTARDLNGSQELSKQAEYTAGAVVVYDATATDRWWGNTSGGQNISPGQTAVGAGTWDATLTHELGHGIEESLDSTGAVARGFTYGAPADDPLMAWNSAWSDYHTASQAQMGPDTPSEKTYISYYSNQNAMEGFAETFALVTHGGYDKSAYDPTSQALITQMENIVK